MSEPTFHGWPLVAFDRCEANYATVPAIAEFWSAATGLVIAASGLFTLLSSTYSDDVVDLVNALTVCNGIASMLAHGSLLRIFGLADALSINLGALLYTKAIVLAHRPSLVAEPAPRSLLNLVIVCAMLFSVSWNRSTTPKAFENVDMSTLALLPCSAIAVVGMISLAYGRATWHLGRVKRVFMRGTLIFVVGIACWLSEEAGALPCPTRFTLHPVWHVCSAHSLMAWSAFLKYHRGLFFGFRVEMKGWWWCPYAVWREPADPMSNPIVRHASGDGARYAGGRRNTYLESKMPRPAMSTRGLWRGGSFFCRSSVLAAGRRLSTARRLSLRGNLSEGEAAGAGQATMPVAETTPMATAIPSAPPPAEHTGMLCV